MTIQTIPYGDRAILVSDNFVYICDRILLKSDFESPVELMAEVQRIYEDYRSKCNGEQ